MNHLYIVEALKNVKNPNILVNMVSQRVRQLNQGHKALIATDVRMSYMDIALKEIADGKLAFEMGPVDDFDHEEESRKKKAAKKR